MSKIWDALQKVEKNRDGEPGAAERVPGRAPLTQKQLAAVRGLLEADSLANAAEISGVTERTLRKWLEQPGFMAAYYAAGEAHLAQSLPRLRAATSDAIEVLRSALSDENPMVRIGAAAAIFRAAGFGPRDACAGDSDGGTPTVDDD